VTADRLLDQMIARLLRDHGGAKHRWRRSIGPVRVYSLATHAHCNWSISPTGDYSEITAIERLCDDMRMTHAIISER